MCENQYRLTPAELSLLLNEDYVVGDDDEVTNGEDLLELYKNTLEKFELRVLQNNEEDTRLIGIDILSLVKQILAFYIQENYTGPPLRWNEDKIEISSEEALLDGESIVENVKSIQLILRAEYLLKRLQSFSTEGFPSIHWWRIRTYFLHQQFLEEKSTVLWDLIRKEITLFKPYSEPHILGVELVTYFYVELSEIYSYYYDIESAKSCVTKAKNTIGISLNPTGVLGKRTKFQQTQISQLVLKVTVHDSENDQNKNSQEEMTLTKFPTSVLLEDEDRLDKIQLVEDIGVSGLNISPIQHLVILAEFSLMRKYLPLDGIYSEELLAYLAFLIEHPKVWAVQMVALLQRSVIEVNNRRTVERSMKQLEVLHKESAEITPSVSHRLKFFYGSGMLMKWEIDVSLAQVLSSLNLFKEALQISLGLNRWEDVISCYTNLKLRHKAEEVIREKLSSNPTVKLWILLGDATDNPEHYETAWKLSKEKSARAQRQWGYFHFVRKQYAESIPHLQKSLELNPLENPAWIRLGYAALEIEDWTLSTKAYQHSSTLDGDNFEIWNNLANGFVKLGEKQKALRALKEACKCNYESWKVWDNTLVVATDCKAFDEVIKAYNRLLDLKGKWIDEEVLEILVKAIVTNIKDANDQPSRNRYYKPTLTLFGKITSLVTNNAKIWKLYSDLLLVEESIIGNNGSDLELTWSKSCNYSQKSVESILSDSNWMKLEAKIEDAVEYVVEYIKRVISYKEKYLETSSEAVTKAEFTIKRVYGGIKKTRDTAIVPENFEKYLTEIKLTAELLGIQI